jgi:hypothetical protein
MPSSSYFKTAIACAALVCNFLTPVFAQDNNTDPWKDYHPCPNWLPKQGGVSPASNQLWEATLSPYTLHWSKSNEHKNVFLGSIDREVAGNRLCGISFFTNSFGQPSTYLYVGQRWNPLPSDDKLFLKVTAGVLYGYVGVYRNKVPLNHNGFSPAVIPSLGYMFSSTDSAQVLLLGTAGIMLAYGHRF